MSPLSIICDYEVPQASTGFSPFELLYGIQPCGSVGCPSGGVGDTRPHGRSPSLLYGSLTEKITDHDAVGPVRAGKVQEEQQQCYDAHVTPQNFKVGQQVLLLLLASHNKLLMQWQGPYELVETVGDMYYRIQVPSHGVRLYHVNLLKAWQAPEGPGWYQAEINWDEQGRNDPKNYSIRWQQVSKHLNGNCTKYNR